MKHVTRKCTTGRHPSRELDFCGAPQVCRSRDGTARIEA